MNIKIKVTIEPGLSAMKLDFAHAIEEKVGQALQSLGFVRNTSSWSDDQIFLVYRQFGVCIDKEDSKNENNP